ncbi:hypothetical protein L1987_33753 [Smallanthus sonchifolius]|uniref:Uncharacterized protein n=1 Tax=Smallanthus sonchifolius TaxID=185202 RepID=A0ACB9HTC9_9ASTR|nr:hypothetical protein L1987_33753 [Smallanthus sonchifolius]
MMIKAELQKKLPHPNISHSAQMLQLLHLHTMLPYGIPINVMMNAQPRSHSDRDNMIRRIPYLVALKHKNETCAALLNPSFAEPLVWPSPLKFISELNQDAKALLEQALIYAILLADTQDLYTR